MAAVAFILAFLALGAAVIFVAFSGGPSQAREAYLTGGRRTFRFIIPAIYVGIGIAIPVLVIANHDTAEGGVGSLKEKKLSANAAEGRKLFKQTCQSCHSLAATNARGVTGPNLDEVGQVTKARVMKAIEIGGTGQGRMPPHLLEPKDAALVGEFLSQVAGAQH
ncbi:MAG: cytochrome [Thermoleophilaceae bacterium]|jgi:cytochrome c553|nr:cytochrome [Thermoleophilaceae bacterium]